MPLRFLTLVISVSLIVLLAARANAAATPAVIDESLSKAKAWLYSKQNADGNWDEVAVPEKPSMRESFREPKAGQFQSMAKKTVSER